jgi:hypothetical protein
MTIDPKTVQAAAERLRRVKAGEDAWHIYDGKPGSGMETDEATLAAAYLALAAEVRAVVADMEWSACRTPNDSANLKVSRDRLRAAVGEGK